MSFTFITAARIAMSREGFDTWLDAPVPPASRIENPAEMFAGWWWSDRTPQWSTDAVVETPRSVLAARAADPQALTVLRHHDGALEAYLWTVGHSGFWEPPAQRLLLMLAGAAAFKTDDTEDHVLFWEDAAGTLPSGNDPALISLLAVGRGSARFVGSRPLTDLLTRLAPVEEAFAELAESYDD
ncbi:hypothetical protein [Dactylosporangium sp. NPDC000521]|uniref:hypothetical protein n=1 Tax=Dactylosporangium sp. NPDC000521 TaxID=3363975 RepID=UPI0036C65D70